MKTVDQSPAYPMQLMPGVYEFRDAGSPPSGRSHPQEFVVDRFRAYTRAD